MKVWTCRGFEGYNPVGTALVVVASSLEEAESLVLDELENQGLPQKRGIQLQELNTEVAQVRILNNGDY